jgi:hypothetical protein
MKKDQSKMCQAITAMIVTAFLPSWTTFSLIVGRQGANNELAGLSLNQETSQKELEGIQKMAQCRTSPRRSGKSTAKNKSTSPGPTLKKDKNKCAFIYYCFIFIEVFRELSKHTPNINSTLFNK